MRLWYNTNMKMPRVPMTLIALLIVIVFCIAFAVPAVLLRMALGLPEMPYDPLFIFGGLVVGFLFSQRLGAWMSREE